MYTSSGTCACNTVETWDNSRRIGSQRRTLPRGEGARRIESQRVGVPTELFDAYYSASVEKCLRLIRLAFACRHCRATSVPIRPHHARSSRARTNLRPHPLRTPPPRTHPLRTRRGLARFHIRRSTVSIRLDNRRQSPVQCADLLGTVGVELGLGLPGFIGDGVEAG